MHLRCWRGYLLISWMLWIVGTDFWTTNFNKIMGAPALISRVVFACSLLSLVSATITAGDKHFQSMPAVFGKPFSMMRRDDMAHLQLLNDNPFLCQGGPFNERHLMGNDQTSYNEDNHIVPSDGLPIAVLVSRGGCSFEEKARAAMTYGYIKYVIVYDDRARSALVPMSATDPDNITVGMLFVSRTSGMLLKRMILDQPANVTENGGMIITMDAQAPLMPPNYEQTQQWMLAAMGGFFAFMACFGCLLIGIHAGYIPANGRIVIGPNGVRPAASSRRLLTEAQVHRLPHETYVKGTDDDHHISGCAICLEEYIDGEMLQVLPCSHKFHTHCIVPCEFLVCVLCRNVLVYVC
jgi:hypothetical protein